MPSSYSPDPASSSDATPAASNLPPTNWQLSPRWLTISLIAVTLIPVSLAVTVWLAIPENPEPTLPVELALEPVPWANEDGQVRLMPGVRIENPTNDRWMNVSMAINKQFYFYCPAPLEAGSDFRVPLAFFKTSGNQPYRPTVVPLRLMTVYAQLPSGQRAIRDFKQPAPPARQP